MRVSTVEYMKIVGIVVELVSINVMDDLSALCAGYLSMFQRAPRSLATIAQAERVDTATVWPVASRGRCRKINRLREICDGAYHFVASAVMLTVRQAIKFFGVGKERVTVFSPHLIMAKAHLTSHCGAVAVLARAADDAATPPVIRTAMALLALVVHQAQAVGGVTAITAFNRAVSVQPRRGHCESLRALMQGGIYQKGVRR